MITRINETVDKDRLTRQFRTSYTDITNAIDELNDLLQICRKQDNNISRAIKDLDQIESALDKLVYHVEDDCGIFI